MTTHPKPDFESVAQHWQALGTAAPALFQAILTEEDSLRAQQTAEALHEYLLAQSDDHPLNSLLDMLEDRIHSFEQEHHPHTPDPLGALAYLMEAHHLSQNALAKELNLDQSTLSKVLGGQRAMSKAYAIKLSQRFGLSLDFLLTPAAVSSSQVRN